MDQQEAIVSQLMEGDLFEAIGMKSLPQEEKEELLYSMCQTIYARVFQRIAQTLDEDSARQFMNIPADEMGEFLAARDVDLASALMEESARYRMELILVYASTQVPGAELGTMASV